jgi:hypothetical protein
MPLLFVLLEKLSLTHTRENRGMNQVGIARASCRSSGPTHCGGVLLLQQPPTLLAWSPVPFLHPLMIRVIRVGFGGSDSALANRTNGSLKTMPLKPQKKEAHPKGLYFDLVIDLPV